MTVYTGRMPISRMVWDLWKKWKISFLKRILSSFIFPRKISYIDSFQASYRQETIVRGDIIASGRDAHARRWKSRWKLKGGCSNNMPSFSHTAIDSENGTFWSEFVRIISTRWISAQSVLRSFRLQVSIDVLCFIKMKRKLHKKPRQHWVNDFRENKHIGKNFRFQHLPNEHTGKILSSAIPRLFVKSIVKPFILKVLKILALQLSPIPSSTGLIDYEPMIFYSL